MLFIFMLWELPAIIFMTVHERALRAQGKLFISHHLGIWAYRLIGMATVWPIVLVIVYVSVIQKP